MHLRYLRYVVRHKWFVFLECLKLGMLWLGITHDLSRFLPDEWKERARYNFGGKSPRDATGHPTAVGSEEYHLALHMHFQRNKHHWQWWIWNRDDGTIKVFPMSDRHRHEMLADMRGAGRAQDKPNTFASYYKANRNKMILHPETREWLEKQINTV